jgi:hypothetical protein
MGLTTGPPIGCAPFSELTNTDVREPQQSRSRFRGGATMLAGTTLTRAEPIPAETQKEPWRLLTAPGTLRLDLSGSARSLPPGTTVALCCRALGSRRRCRRFAADAGIEVLREYLAIPSAVSPTCYVEDTPLALRFFLADLLTLPRGSAASSAVLGAVKKAAGIVFPSALVGAVAPIRIVLGRVQTRTTGSVEASPVSGGSNGFATNLLDVPDSYTVVLALSKDPNGKLTVLLIPHGSSRPAVAVKVSTTEAAEASIAAERRVLSELRERMPDTILATIPRIANLPGVAAHSVLATSALPGSPMTTRYHAWRHVATEAAVQADFTAAETWLARFQGATAGSAEPLDMDGGRTAVLRRRFARDPFLDEVLARLGAIHARLRGSRTPRTAVHGDFWFGNLLLVGPDISGVIDWEAGDMVGEPVRDLVRFGLAYALYLDRHTRAGRHVAGHRGLRAGEWGCGIEFALTGEGWFPNLFRRFIRDGLARLGADPDSWRDATLAGIAEVAATADDDAFASLHWRLFDRLSSRSALTQ